MLYLYLYFFILIREPRHFSLRDYEPLLIRETIPSGPTNPSFYGVSKSFFLFIPKKYFNYFSKISELRSLIKKYLLFIINIYIYFIQFIYLCIRFLSHDFLFRLYFLYFLRLNLTRRSLTRRSLTRRRERRYRRRSNR